MNCAMIRFVFLLTSGDNEYMYMYTKILEVNLFAFAYRLFRRDFSPLDFSPLDEYIYVDCM